MANISAPDWHVQYRKRDGDHIAWYTTPEEAIEAVCTLIDDRFDVYGIGFGLLDNSIAKDQIDEIHDVWTRARPRCRVWSMVLRHGGHDQRLHAGLRRDAGQAAHGRGQLMRRALLALIALLSAAPAAKAAGYTPLGVQFFQTQLMNSSSLGSVVDNCVGTFAMRVKGQLAARPGGRTTLNDGQIFSNYDESPTVTTYSSEGVHGFNIIFDNAAGGGYTANGNIRINRSSSDRTALLANDVVYNRSYTNPLLNSAWNSIVASWNFCGGNDYQAIYVNGVQQSYTNTIIGSGNINYSGSGGSNPGIFVLGYKATDPLGNPAYYDIDDVVLDTSNAIVNSASVIPATYLNNYYNNGPVNINASGNCSGLTGAHPTFCFTTSVGGGGYSLANFQTNLGWAGGSWAKTALYGEPFAASGVPPAGRPAGQIGELWTQTGQTLSTTSASVYADLNVISPGDLLLLSVDLSATSTTPGLTCPTGWTQVFPAYADSYRYVPLTELCYKLAGGFSTTASSAPSTSSTTFNLASCTGWVAGQILYDVAPGGKSKLGTLSGCSGNTVTLTSTAASAATGVTYAINDKIMFAEPGTYTIPTWTGTYSVVWILQDYQGVDQTNPLDTFSYIENLGSAARGTSQPVANLQTSYPNDMIVEITTNTNYNTAVVSAVPAGMNFRATFPGGVIAAFDGIAATPGLTSFGNMTLAVAQPSFVAAVSLKPASTAQTK